VSEPPSPPYYPPPQPLKKQGLSTNAIIAIVVAVVVVVIVVGAVIAGAFLAGVQNASVLSEPNVALTDTHGYVTGHCGAYLTNTTDWDWSATLVNTGGGGFVDIGYYVNGQQVSHNTYYVNAKSQLPITQSITLNECYGSTNPTYRIAVLAERSA